MNEQLHDWERLKDEKNDGLFQPIGGPDFLAVWRCKKCGWRINSGVDGSEPDPAKKLFRRRPNEPEEWYNCSETIALSIMES